MVFLPDPHSRSELYFLRHGLAGQYGDPTYKDDSLRPLTKEGQEKMRSASLGMKNLGLKFDIILSSPYLRAKQTAEIVAQVYKIKTKDICLTDNLLPPATIKELLRKLTPYKSILLVGHEPHLSELVSSLLNCDQPLAIDFKKGGLCSLSITQPLGKASAILNWLLTPGQLALLSKEKQAAPRPK